ncbi:endonuclease/exonuclease/phosphatase family protein [Eubacteriales bacterium OttesenSCG-928-N13]|nr:endonuclease/exonuclease/phosphatase family protein [Eubacteriales bacterium OttesenSCG-928-N13]
MKRILKWIGILLIIVIAVALGYVGYVFASYSRISDDLPLETNGVAGDMLNTGEQYKIATYNIGFGAYDAEFSFFMDGGERARAVSQDAVLNNTKGAASVLLDQGVDIALLQEVDIDSDRSHHVDQLGMLKADFADHQLVSAINYDSAYLPYPFHEPIGKSKSSIAVLSRFPMENARRYSLPIMQDVSKIVDLDRCFIRTELPTQDGKMLCLYNVHMSAYLSDQQVHQAQIETLMSKMQQDYEAGHYVICGGDFNHDMTGDSATKFGFETGSQSWAMPFPTEYLPAGFHIEADDSIPSCRNADEPYQPGHTFVITVDGFIVSDNVQVDQVMNIDTAFAYSDHTPVVMSFTLQ